MMNETALHEHVHGWISEPRGRGTASLLYSCLFTIFVCTWSALHPNIPPRERSQSRLFYEKLVLMSTSILAPELISLVAFAEFVHASRLMRRSKQWPEGFLEKENSYTKAHAYFTLMGGFEVKCTDGTHRLNAEEFDDLVTKGAIQKLSITEGDIADKSKSDWLGKLIACAQIFWLVAQLIGRAVQRLPVTPLELFAFGIIVCTLCTYAASWHKPKDVQLPVLIPTSAEGKTFRELFKEDSPRSNVPYLTGLLLDDDDVIIRILGLAGIVTALFGACHIVAWNFSFPSFIEMVVWRASSISCLACSCLLIMFVVVSLLGCTPDRGDHSLWALLYVPCEVCYVLARLFLLVESFVSLRWVPEGVYHTVNWSLYLPHL